MNKSNAELVYDLIVEDPIISNSEIEELLNLPFDTAKTYIYRLKDRGFIKEIDSLEGRKFEIIKPFYDRRLITKKITSKEKQSYYEEMIEVYMEDFRVCSTFDDRLRVGREIRLLIEKL